MALVQEKTAQNRPVMNVCTRERERERERERGGVVVDYSYVDGNSVEK